MPPGPRQQEHHEFDPSLLVHMAWMNNAPSFAPVGDDMGHKRKHDQMQVQSICFDAVTTLVWTKLVSTFKNHHTECAKKQHQYKHHLGYMHEHEQCDSSAGHALYTCPQEIC